MKATRALLADGSAIITEAGPGRCWDSEEVAAVEFEVEPRTVRCSLCEELIDEGFPVVDERNDAEPKP